MIEDISKRMYGLTVAKAIAEKRVSEIQTKLDTTDADLEEYVGAIKLCQRCLDEQADSKKFIEDITNALISAMFEGEDIKYILQPQISDDGNLTGFKSVYTENGIEVVPKRMGGGLRNITSLGIRLGILIILHKLYDCELLLFMDEQLLNIDENKWPRLVKVFEGMRESGIPLQFFLISHAQMTLPHELHLIKTGRVTRTQLVQND